MPRLASSAGIAFGPILFVLAILGVLAAVMASSMGSFTTAGKADRVTSDVAGQANLIRSKIHECQMQFEINAVDNSSAPPWDSPASCAGDHYPCADTTNGTLVSALTCPNDPLSGGNQPSIWTGPRVGQLPPPTQGFDAWMYINAGDAGGRCIWTAPTGGSTDTGIIAGLTAAAAKFSGQEVAYSAGSASQKFVIFITPPTGAADSHCTVP